MAAYQLWADLVLKFGILPILGQLVRDDTRVGMSCSLPGVGWGGDDLDRLQKYPLTLVGR